MQNLKQDRHTHALRLSFVRKKIWLSIQYITKDLPPNRTITYKVFSAFFGIDNSFAKNILVEKTDMLQLLFLYPYTSARFMESIFRSPT